MYHPKRYTKMAAYSVEVQIPGTDGELVWYRVGGFNYIVDAKADCAELVSQGWRVEIDGKKTARPVVAARVTVYCDSTVKATVEASGDRLTAALAFNAALLSPTVAAVPASTQPRADIAKLARNVDDASKRFTLAVLDLPQWRETSPEVEQTKADLGAAESALRLAKAH